MGGVDVEVEMKAVDIRVIALGSSAVVVEWRSKSRNQQHNMEKVIE